MGGLSSLISLFAKYLETVQPQSHRRLQAGQLKSLALLHACWEHLSIRVGKVSNHLPSWLFSGMLHLLYMWRVENGAFSMTKEGEMDNVALQVLYNLNSQSNLVFHFRKTRGSWQNPIQ